MTTRFAARSGHSAAVPPARRRRRVSADERARVDADFAVMAEDAEYQAQAQEIYEELARADCTALDTNPSRQ